MGWMKSTPPSKRPKQSKPTKAEQKQAVSDARSWGKSMGMKEGKAKAANRYKDIYFPSGTSDRLKGKKPGGHLIHKKGQKIGDVAFPKKRGK